MELKSAIGPLRTESFKIHRYENTHEWLAFGASTKTVRAGSFSSGYAKSISKQLQQKMSMISFIHSGQVLPGDLVRFKNLHPHLLPALQLHDINSICFSLTFVDQIQKIISRYNRNVMEFYAEHLHMFLI